MKLDESERTVTSLLETLNFDYFKLLDLLTIARSRKHIEKYYDMTEIGEFPERAKPVNIKADIRSILTAPSRQEAERLLDLTVGNYSKSAYRLAKWMQTALPEGFTVFMLPSHHRRKLQTANMLEQVKREVKRRTRVAILFPNEASLLRLVSAVLMEISEDGKSLPETDGGTADPP